MGRKCLQMSSNVSFFLQNEAVFNRMWTQAVGLGRTQHGGKFVAVCTLCKFVLVCELTGNILEKYILPCAL